VKKLILALSFFTAFSCRTKVEDKSGHSEASTTSPQKQLASSQNKAPENKMNLAETKEAILKEITDAKKEMASYKNSLTKAQRADPKMQGVVSLIDKALEKSDEEVLTYITSHQYLELLKNMKASPVRVIDNEPGLQLAGETGFYLSDVPPTPPADNKQNPTPPTDSTQQDLNAAGSTWLLASAFLTPGGTALSLPNVIIGSIMKDKGSEASQDLVTAGKVFNIASGSITTLVGAGLLAGAVADGGTRRPRGAKIASGVFGAGLLAVGISQIVAGADMGLAEGTGNSTFLETLGEHAVKIQSLMSAYGARI
jgi:hypothetical protein